METTKPEGMPLAADTPAPRSFAELAEQPNGAAGAKLAVRFFRRWTVYFAGDVAVFPQRMAQRLVNDGYGEPVNVRREGPVPPGAVYATRYPVPLAERRKRNE